jgi:hypothetical protein
MKNQSVVQWLEKELSKNGSGAVKTFADLFEQAKAMEEERYDWKVVYENTPPSDVELLVQSPEGVVHLSHWREGYNIFTCQAKSESSFNWMWKAI